ncbi:N-6 DNA methylase [Thermomonospora umbrina]|uniref:Type I restriction-modification system DNA methylase subunit n=1 Tax=Thermomonospora umbrina TaxID=111806 RepID=A0A3D9SWG2_9ACTN|nr:N-6 DNA methylase [Thermomonospora umbrina]REE95981.1 type I restriction-modification system DNA methylase subunit [Thermomonospora umbrina]
MSAAEIVLVPPAEIARMAGVTRAAVSNWRRRHPDFPEPAGGTNSAPLFALPDVARWLDRQGKGRQVADEVRLWQALRAERGEDMIGALTATAAELYDQRADPPLTRATAELIANLARDRTPAGLVGDLVERYVASASRSGGDHVSTPALVRAMRHFAGETTGTVYDPACGIGDLLLSVGGKKVVRRVGQDVAEGLTAFVGLRAALEARSGTTEVVEGDALRKDHFPGLRADLVVCDPPSGQTDWGRDDVLLDPRWELGLPPKVEGDLAWLQHCYFHTAPGGRAVLALPASAAYRRSGRRIRAELVRGGMLDTMVALPGGLAAGHALPVHLWILRRPVRSPGPDTRVRMIDLTEADLNAPIEPTADQVTSVPAIRMLDDEVDLTPSRYVAANQEGQAAAYGEARERFAALLDELRAGLPELSEGDHDLVATINVNELIRGGLVRLRDGRPVSTTDQLDDGFLQGFLASAANIRRNTSGSGTHRADPRGARVPQMDLERQRAYGAAFRELEIFVQRLEEAAKMGRRAVRLARDGLTGGTLDPAPTTNDTKRGNDA